MKVSALLILIISAFSEGFTQPDASYVRNEILFKVSSRFNSIQLEQGKVLTDKDWFNEVSQMHSVVQLGPIFTGNKPELVKVGCGPTAPSPHLEHGVAHSMFNKGKVVVFAQTVF